MSLWLNHHVILDKAFTAILAQSKGLN